MFETSHSACVQGGSSGTLVVPARSPYDRQMLREHVERLVNTVPTLTLGVHGAQWTITRRGVADSRCAACTQPLGRLSCSREGEADPACIDCVLHTGADDIMEETTNE